MNKEKLQKNGIRRAAAMAVALSAISVFLIVASFFVPPMGVIDGSVLASVGELFAFAALFKIGEAIERGMDAKVTHRDTTIEVNNPDGDKEQ